MNRTILSVCLAIGLATEAVPINAQSPKAMSTPAAKASTVAPVEKAPAAKPSATDYFWAPNVAPDGPVLIMVSVESQRAYVYRNGVLIGASKVSTGKAGHETPTGIFTILQKDPDHHSNKYSNAPMPFMERLTWDGVALHGGHVTDRPASHGCIRLPLDFARDLYEITRLGLTVVVSKTALAPEAVPSPALLDNPNGDGHAPPTAYSWHPERSDHGPYSIVISSRDRKMVVLRNGIAVGSSTILIDGAVTQTMAFSLRAIDTTGFHWLRLALPGVTLALQTELTPQERARVHLPEAFRALLAGTLKPGTTILVTRDALPKNAVGKHETILQSEGH